MYQPACDGKLVMELFYSVCGVGNHAVLSGQTALSVRNCRGGCGSAASPVDTCFRNRRGILSRLCCCLCGGLCRRCCRRCGGRSYCWRGSWLRSGGVGRVGTAAAKQQRNQCGGTDHLNCRFHIFPPKVLVSMGVYPMNLKTYDSCTFFNQKIQWHILLYAAVMKSFLQFAEQITVAIL